jgi:hypothetical protein
MELPNIQRSQGLCEMPLCRGPYQGRACRYRARWERLGGFPDAGLRVCGVHARAFTPESLVEIGS